MTIDDIFAAIAVHMKEGILFHDYLSICYDFIGITKYAKDHSQHYMEESKGYRSLLHYYCSHYHKLLKLKEPVAPTPIPESWYRYDTFQVDVKTKMATIEELTTKWVDWERATKKLYSEMYCAALEIKDAAAAIYIDKLVTDVTKELKQAEQLLIDLQSINYDLPTIFTGW